MNKFEQVSSDDHQMPVAGGQGQYWGEGVPLGLMSKGIEGTPRSDVRGEGTLYHVSYPMMHVMYLPPAPGQND